MGFRGAPKSDREVQHQMLHRTPFRAMKFRLHSFVILAALVVASTAKGGTLPSLTAAARSSLCDVLREHRKGWECSQKWETNPSQPPSGWLDRFRSLFGKNYCEMWIHPEVSNIHWVKFPSHELSYLVFVYLKNKTDCKSKPIHVAKFVYHKNKHWYRVQ